MNARYLQEIREVTSAIAQIAGAALLLMTVGALLAGCAAPAHRQTHIVPPSPAPIVQPPPEPVIHKPVIEWAEVLREEVPPVPVPSHPREYKDLITTTAATFPFNPEREYVLTCPMWELLTIRLSPGETYQDHGAANPVEWMIQPVPSTVDGLPVTVLLIKRGPQAPTTSLTVITDGNTYRLRLQPEGRGENRGVRYVRFWDPAAEERRHEARLAAEEQRRRRANEPHEPTVNYAIRRQQTGATYIGGQDAN